MAERGKGASGVRDSVLRRVLAAAVVTVAVAATMTALHTSRVAMELEALAKAPVAVLSPSVPAGAQGVDIGEPLMITAIGGTLSTVNVTGPGGKPLPGTLNPDRTRWISEPLDFNSEYTATATGIGHDGRPAAPLNAVFRTVAPANTLQVQRVRPSNGQVVGVAMPISIYFNRDITDRAAVERQLTVTTSVPTVGSFHWVDDNQVNWRPKEYWKSGTKVTVSSALRGLHAGAGTYGAADYTSSFTIGRHQEVLGQVNKHTLTLLENGRAVRTFPASYGRAQYPTQYGVHVAFEKHPTKRMRSDSWGGPVKGEPGFYDEVLPLAVRISNNGEFVHVNGATVGAQGRSNVSHGCINLSPANGRTFYNWVQIGDPVNIVGSSRPLTKADGDIADWLMSWDDYVAGSALRGELSASSPGPKLAK